MKARLIPANSNDPIKIVDIPDKGLDQLKEMQRLIGGHVEQVQTNTLHFQGNVMLVDEDGRAKGRPANYRAMSTSGYAGIITGDALIVGLKASARGDGSTWVTDRLIDGM